MKILTLVVQSVHPTKVFENKSEIFSPMKTDGIPVEDFYNELDFRESQEIDEHISRSPEIDERPSIDPTLYDDYDPVMDFKLF